MKKIFWSAKFIFIFSLILSNLISDIFIVKAQTNRLNLFSQNSSNSSTNKKLKLPKVPQRGTPQGNKNPGATRPESFCPPTNQPVTALIANNGKDFTLSNYPSFWFYIPYQPENINYIEFALKDNQTATTIYRTEVEFTGTSSQVIKVNIPEEEKYALETGNNYSWDLMLSCQGNPSDEPDIMVKGWIQRIEIDSQLEDELEQLSERELYQFYWDNDIWYDAINKLAEQYYLNPYDEEIKADWFSFLKNQNLTELDVQMGDYN